MSSKDKKIKTEGLTTQEYSLKYALPLESLIHQNNSVEENTELHSFEKKIPNDEQRTILKAYYDLNLLNTLDNEVMIFEEVRKLDYLYWVREKVQDLGFLFKESNEYKDDSHKIITSNYLVTNKKNLNLIDIQNYEIKNFSLYLSIVLMCKGYISKGYIFLKDIDENVFDIIKNHLDKFDTEIVKLDITNENFIARLKTSNDCENLKNYINEYIEEIPCLYEKFYMKTPKASITKKLVFDSAHYITDHDGKCKNLHGGRYDIEITIQDRIDPMTGFVIDYSLIKNITKNLVINKFDHKTLNLTCPELSWRSSTEFLSIVIWETLIEYLPNLKKIKIYETETSYCEYKGNSLREFIKYGPSEILGYFKNLDRRQSCEEENIFG